MGIEQLTLPPEGPAFVPVEATSRENTTKKSHPLRNEILLHEDVERMPESREARSKDQERIPNNQQSEPKAGATTCHDKENMIKREDSRLEPELEWERFDD